MINAEEQAIQFFKEEIKEAIKTTTSNIAIHAMYEVLNEMDPKFANPFKDQEDFMYKGQQTISYHNPDQIYLYARLIKEEAEELSDAISLEPKENILKEATDLLVVTIGLIKSFGVNASTIWKLVHANNMKKLTYEVVKDSNGKIQKSPESIKDKEKLMDSIRELLKWN